MVIKRKSLITKLFGVAVFVGLLATAPTEARFSAAQENFEALKRYAQEHPIQATLAGACLTTLIIATGLIAYRFFSKPRTEKQEETENKSTDHSNSPTQEKTDAPQTGSLNTESSSSDNGYGMFGNESIGNTDSLLNSLQLVTSTQFFTPENQVVNESLIEKNSNNQIQEINNSQSIIIEENDSTSNDENDNDIEINNSFSEEEKEESGEQKDEELKQSTVQKPAQMNYWDALQKIRNNEDLSLALPKNYSVEGNTIVLRFSDKGLVEVEDDSVFLLPIKNTDHCSLLWIKDATLYEFIQENDLQNALRNSKIYRVVFAQNSNCLCGGCQNQPGLFDVFYKKKQKKPDLVGYWQEISSQVSEAILPTKINYNGIKSRFTACSYDQTKRITLKEGCRYHILSKEVGSIVRMKIDSEKRLYFFDPFHSEWLDSKDFGQRFKNSVTMTKEPENGVTSYNFTQMDRIFSENV